MEQRKLVAFGTSSFIISLPKQWIEKNRLAKGDSITIDERNNELLLSVHDTEERKKLSETTIDIEGKSIDQLKTEIIAAYINSSDIIIIKGARGENSAKIKSILHNLSGIEVVEETLTKIVVKDLLDIKEVSVDNLVRRVDIIIRSMLEDLKKMDKDTYPSLLERDKEVNRMVLLGSRVVRAAFGNPRVAKLFGTSYFNLLCARQILINMERFADEIKRIARQYSSNDLRKNKMPNIKELVDGVTFEYEKAMKLYYSNDREAAYKQGSDIKKFFTVCDKFLEKHNTVECARLVERFKYMVGAVTTILRSTMEKE